MEGQGEQRMSLCFLVELLLKGQKMNENTFMFQDFL